VARKHKGQCSPQRHGTARRLSRSRFRRQRFSLLQPPWPAVADHHHRNRRSLPQRQRVGNRSQKPPVCPARASQGRSHQARQLQLCRVHHDRLHAHCPRTNPARQPQPQAHSGKRRIGRVVFFNKKHLLHNYLSLVLHRAFVRLCSEHTHSRSW
jgi:hypothetical protein